MIEINKCIVGPKLLTQLLPRHHLAGSFEQQAENSKRLLLQPNPRAILVQLSGVQVGGKSSEPKCPSRAAECSHSGGPADVCAQYSEVLSTLQLPSDAV